MNIYFIDNTQIRVAKYIHSQYSTLALYTFEEVILNVIDLQNHIKVNKQMCSENYLIINVDIPQYYRE